MRRAAMVAAVVALAGCGGDEETLTVPEATETAAVSTAAPPEEQSQSVEEFLAAHARAYSIGQLGRIYATLHPAQREIVSRSEFDECFHDAAQVYPGEAVGVEVIDSYNETIEIPGTGESEASLAVTYKPKVKIDDDALEGGGTTVEGNPDTMHVFKVDGGYAWIISPEAIKAIENDQPC